MPGLAYLHARFGGSMSLPTWTDPVAATDINTATAAELDAVEGLQGHGYEIVRYREERGRFTDARQLDEVPGLAGVLSDRQRAALIVGPA